MSIFLVSRDAPNLQRAFAGLRNWGYRLASHGAGDYASEQTVMEGEANMPGAVVYQRDGDSITRKNSDIFGPGDLYCSVWNWRLKRGRLDAAVPLLESARKNGRWR